jgi:DNA-binding FadR family transcriptional regulator
MSSLSERRSGRLYLAVVERLQQEIEGGVYGVGDRLPSERELAERLAVSRPVVREAIMVLQNRGLVRSRHGAGVFVQARNQGTGAFGVHAEAGPFEVIETRRLLEGEIAALAAQSITEAQLAELEAILPRIGDTSLDNASREQADRAFHIAVARATGNEVLVDLVGNLWDMRYRSALCEYYFRRAREAGIQPPMDEHRLVLDALRARDSEGARQVMRDHLTHVTQNLLIASEEDVRERARLQVEEKRYDYARRAGVRV